MTRFLLHRHGVGGAKRFGTACRVLGASLCAVALVVGLLPTLAEAADASRKGFAVVDASGVQWKGDVADIDLFAGVDAARPGSSGTYVFSVENGNDFPVECTLSVAGKAVVDGAAGEESLGLEYRLRDGGGAYLAGADDAWVAEGELYRGTMAAESGLSGLQLEWRWPLDASDAANAVDTSLASGDAPQLTLMLTARAEGEGNPDAPDVSVPSDGVTDGEGNPIPGADVTVNPDGSVDVVLPPGYEGDVKVEIGRPRWQPGSRRGRDRHRRGGQRAPFDHRPRRRRHRSGREQGPGPRQARPEQPRRPERPVRPERLGATARSATAIRAAKGWASAPATRCGPCASPLRRSRWRRA